VCPNIDRRGRIARAITGSLCIAFGVVCWLIGWPEAVGVRWIVVLTAMAAGVFQLFEAKNSWCFMRACGIKTPM
jgi:hypothetical protein